MLEIMTRLYKGVKISLDVEVRGAATTVAATYPDPFQSGRCTLMGLDGEAMFGDEAMRKKLPALMDYMGGSQLARLIGKPGVRFETRPEVTFTFAAPAASR
jgi:hypothetical protein